MSLDDEITGLIGSPDMATAESLMHRYPYFQFPAMMMLRYGAATLSPEQRRACRPGWRSPPRTPTYCACL